MTEYIYINTEGERIDIPESYYVKYTKKEFEEEGHDLDGCSCGMTFSGSGNSPHSDYGHDDMVNDGTLQCKCYCHGEN